ncbi:hypothetical protein, partial [Nocardia sp. NPDC004711]
MGTLCRGVGGLKILGRVDQILEKERAQLVWLARIYCDVMEIHQLGGARGRYPIEPFSSVMDAVVAVDIWCGVSRDGMAKPLVER